jgi:hypothetical protein
MNLTELNNQDHLGLSVGEKSKAYGYDFFKDEPSQSPQAPFQWEVIGT